MHLGQKNYRFTVERFPFGSKIAVMIREIFQKRRRFRLGEMNSDFRFPEIINFIILYKFKRLSDIGDHKSNRTGAQQVLYIRRPDIAKLDGADQPFARPNFLDGQAGNDFLLAIRQVQLQA